jgi:DNA-binding CsgD family transcriptional regulator
VETHREHIFHKLSVHSICELVRFAARHRLLD